ncbi:hypothetical protein RvY_07951 [Ramazzottius varieornatus]|uniref:Group XV phospholipase A2 n=1 Tax=Ramazzottius varieornatus TaxID=947166 RepID=A0A1D1V6K7_RAMVA|nr:hypothetical protein RvY_07951 [Ramazzottius varieornatus]
MVRCILFVVLTISASSCALLIPNPLPKAPKLPPWPWIKPTRTPAKPPSDVQLSPVILLPGDGGSQLEARLNKPSVVHYFCAQKTKGWFDLWLNVELLVPYVLDCFVDNMRLVYNNETGRSEDAPGVEVRVRGFGNSTSVEYLDTSRISLSKYFADIAAYLVAKGYQRDVSIRGAPYDFRKAPNELGDYFSNLRKLVEETYEMNNKTAVTFIAHSMGNLIALYLLQDQTAEWKQKYISGFISLAAPWAGAVKAIKAATSGDNLDVSLISAFRVRAEQRTNPSLTFIMPNPESELWGDNETLVSTPERNYTIHDMQAMFHDMNYDDGWEMWKRTANLVDLSPPGVKMYCMYGVGIDTPESMVFGRGQFPDKPPKVIYGDGDGTVNRKSLEYPKQWNFEQEEDVAFLPFGGVTHMTILSDKAVLDQIGKILRLL